VGVSVIIPALNEENHVAPTLASVRHQRPREIIVVDGGSQDGTCRAAAGADVVTSAPRGRAAQMNAGARLAAGDWLLFLHADCLLEEGALADAEACLARRGVAAGCFRMSVLADGILYRSIEACATARVLLTALAYGDQGLFVTRDLFRRIGGFPALRFMEDVYVSARVSRVGRIVVSRKRIFVSPRRWQRAGLVRQSLRNWSLTALTAVGIHPDRLARFYPAIR
jgi:rSAM/selenodomain-associated transferase 2